MLVMYCSSSASNSSLSRHLYISSIHFFCCRESSYEGMSGHTAMVDSAGVPLLEDPPGVKPKAAAQPVKQPNQEDDSIVSSDDEAWLEDVVLVSEGNPDDEPWDSDDDLMALVPKEDAKALATGNVHPEFKQAVREALGEDPWYPGGALKMLMVSLEAPVF